MGLVARALEQPFVYRLWQAPFGAKKLAPVRRHGDLGRARRVLDVGCGPGTNTALFSTAEYVGVDHNPAYIETARRRHNREFVVADVTHYEPAGPEPFDFVLVNSLLHHLDDDQVTVLVTNLASLLTEDGRLHIIELVRPDARSVPQLLAKLDRGKYARSLEHWRLLLGRSLKWDRFEPFDVGIGRLTLWNLLYVRGA